MASRWCDLKRRGERRSNMVGLCHPLGMRDHDLFKECLFLYAVADPDGMEGMAWHDIEWNGGFFIGTRINECIGKQHCSLRSFCSVAFCF